MRTGGRLREKEGMPRVVEALQSNVWTGMDFCTDSRPSLMAAAVVAGSSRGGGGGGNMGGTGSSSGSSEREGKPAAALSASMGDGEPEVVSSGPTRFAYAMVRCIAAVSRVHRGSIRVGRCTRRYPMDMVVRVGRCTAENTLNSKAVSKSEIVIWAFFSRAPPFARNGWRCISEIVGGEIVQRVARSRIVPPLTSL